MSKTTEVIKVNTISLKIHDVEDGAVIVNVDGWRIRLYLEKGTKSNFNSGQTIDASYMGDISNVHSVKFLPIK